MKSGIFCSKLHSESLLFTCSGSYSASNTGWHRRAFVLRALYGACMTFNTSRDVFCLPLRGYFSLHRKQESPGLKGNTLSMPCSFWAELITAFLGSSPLIQKNKQGKYKVLWDREGEGCVDTISAGSLSVAGAFCEISVVRPVYSTFGVFKKCSCFIFLNVLGAVVL